MSTTAERALAHAEPRTYWLDDPARPTPAPPLAGRARADLVVVGGGYTGLWTALLARARHPSATVLLLEAGECGGQGSGRNGGFASASLTHGFGNGLERWPEELDLLDRLGAENLQEMGASIAALGIDCDWREVGELSVATRPHHVTELQELAAALVEHGGQASWLDAAEAQAQVASPTYLGALSEPTGLALVEPARLAWGLRRACLEAGVVVHESTRVVGLERSGVGVELATLGPQGAGRVRAGRVALATNAFPPLLRRLRLMTVPVYDHVLMTEPLTADQLASIGWSGRQGIEQREQTHRLLAEHFLETFPQLASIRFTHRWGGVIDTCTRFSAFFGTAVSGRVGYALGYTGLGVGASRFGAQVVLDLLDGADTERTRLRMVRERPLPFPPEPLRSVGINLTRWSLDRADRRGGRRNLWLRGLDAAGLGFAS